MNRLPKGFKLLADNQLECTLSWCSEKGSVIDQQDKAYHVRLYHQTTVKITTPATITTTTSTDSDVNVCQATATTTKQKERQKVFKRVNGEFICTC